MTILTAALGLGQYDGLGEYCDLSTASEGFLIIVLLVSSYRQSRGKVVLWPCSFFLQEGSGKPQSNRGLPTGRVWRPQVDGGQTSSHHNEAS